MEIKYVYLVGSCIFCSIIYFIIRYFPMFVEKSSKKYIIDKKMALTGLLVTILSLSAGVVLGVYWNHTKFHLFDILITILILTFFLFKGDILNVTTKQYDMKDIKVRAKFAKICTIKWKFNVDKNNAFLMANDTVVRYSREYAQIHYLLIVEQISKIKNINQKRAYITSWRLSHRRLFGNSFFYCIWIVAYSIVGVIYTNNILSEIPNYLINSNEIKVALVTWLSDYFIPIIASLVLMIIIISSIIYLKNDNEFKKQFYADIIDDIKNDIENGKI